MTTLSRYSREALALLVLTPLLMLCAGWRYIAVLTVLVAAVWAGADEIVRNDAQAQEPADLRAQVEQLRAEAVRSRAFIRAAETQLTKVIDAADAILADLDAAPVEPPPVEPPVVDPEPTPEPGDGWLARESKPDAIYLEPGDDLLAAIATGKDVMLPAGSVYRLSAEWTPRAGQLVGMYGEGDRPKIYTEGFGGPSGSASNVQLIKLELIADEDRDGMDSRSGVHIKGSATDWLIEDCDIHGYSAAIVVQGDAGQQVQRVKIHRNILRDTYGHHPHGVLDPTAADYDPYVEPSAHAQGIYLVRAEGVEITENIFWQIGWQFDQPLSRTKFNHGIYAQQLDRDPLNTVKIRGNYFGRCSSHGMQVRGVGIVHDNIVSECAVGISIFKGGELLRSVVLDGQDIPRETRDPRAWGVEALGRPITVGDLVVAHRQGRGSKPGIQVDSQARQAGPVVVFDWINSKGMGVDPAGVLDATETTEAALLVDPTRRVSDEQLQAWLTRAPGSWDEQTSPAAVGAWIRAGYQRVQQGRVYDGTWDRELPGLPRYEVLYWADIHWRDEASRQRTLAAAQAAAESGGVFVIDSKQMDHEAYTNPLVYPDAAALEANVRACMAYADWVTEQTGVAPQLYGSLHTRSWYGRIAADGGAEYRAIAVRPLLAIADEQGRTLIDRLPALDAVNYFSDSWYENWEASGFARARAVADALDAIAEELGKPLYVWVWARQYRAAEHLGEHVAYLRSIGLHVVIWQGPDEPLPAGYREAVLG